MFLGGYVCFAGRSQTEQPCFCHHTAGWGHCSTATQCFLTERSCTALQASSLHALHFASALDQSPQPHKSGMQFFTRLSGRTFADVAGQSNKTGDNKGVARCWATFLSTRGVYVNGSHESTLTCSGLPVPNAVMIFPSNSYNHKNLWAQGLESSCNTRSFAPGVTGAHLRLASCSKPDAARCRTSCGMTSSIPRGTQLAHHEPQCVFYWQFNKGLGSVLLATYKGCLGCPAIVLPIQ